REVLDLLLEAGGRREKFVLRELARTRGWALDRRRQTTTVLQDCAIVVRRYLLGGKTGKVNGAPEAISATGKMVSQRGRAHSRIDAAKDHQQSFRQNIRKRCGERGPRRSLRGFRQDRDSNSSASFPSDIRHPVSLSAGDTPAGTIHAATARESISASYTVARGASTWRIMRVVPMRE